MTFFWEKDIALDPEYIFTPNDQSVVFLSSNTNSLIALDVITGETLWETEVPFRYIHQYDGKFFIFYREKENHYENAPVNWQDSLHWPIQGEPKRSDCSMTKGYTLLALDVNTGEQLWRYTYPGTNSLSIHFEDNYIYLGGSGPHHGTPQLLVQVDASSGSITGWECYRSYSVFLPNEDERVHTYAIVSEDDKYAFYRENIALFMMFNDHRLDVIDGSTKEFIGSVRFDGTELNSRVIAGQNGVIVVYLIDSKQLFSFRLASQTK